ncbi:MAG: Wzy polymerase domain-containing protein [Oceanospirillaceae bacterium]
MYQAQQRQATLFSILIGCVIVLATFYSQQSPGGEGLNLPYNNWVWIFASATICAGVFQIILTKKIVLPKYWLAMATLPLGLIVSGLLIESTKPIEWLFRIGFVVAGYLFFITLFQFKLSKRHIENILYTLCAASIVHSLIALCQINGWNIAELLPQTLANSPISIFQQVNVHASYLVTSFFIALYLATNPSIKNSTFVRKSILLLCVFFTTTVLLIISSRTTLVVFSISAPLMIFARFSQFKKYRTLSISLITCFVIGIVAGNYSSDGFDKYETKLDLQRSHARVSIYDLSWQIFQQKPLFGHGLGNFEKVFQEAKIDYPDSVKLGGQKYTHPHNEFLFWMIEGGITSLAGIFVTLVVTLIALYKTGSRRGAAHIALLFPIGFHTQVELPFYLSSALWFLWLVILFDLHNHFKHTYPIVFSDALKRLISASTVLISTLLIGFFIHSLVSLTGLVNFIRSPSIGYSALATANSNLYFQNITQNITSTTLLYRDIALGQTKFAYAFINWAQRYLENTPTTNTFNDLALAYTYIGEHEKALTLISKAAKMYPATPAIQQRLKEISENIEIKDFKQKIQIRAVRIQGQAKP